MLILGSIVTFECLGNIPGPRRLDGDPSKSSVALVQTPKKTSSRWRIHYDVLNEVGVVLVENINAAVGNHWLDGVTPSGAVVLSPHTDKPYTGTRWRVHVDPQQQPDVFLFECLGNLPGNRWLDGLTASGGVQLAPTTGGVYTGTRWKVV